MSALLTLWKKRWTYPELNSNIHVAIAGAGIVGVSCALWLQHKGFKVTLIDGNTPGSGTTSGCSCTIATYGCIPVNNPEILHQLVRLLLDNDSPLRIDPWHVVTHLPWMVSFLKNCKKSKVEHTTRYMASLLGSTNEGLMPLVHQAGAEGLFSNAGFLNVFDSQADFEHDLPNQRIRAEYGADFRELDTGEIRELEPAMKPEFQRGLLYEDIAHVKHPQKLVQNLFDHFLASGGQHIREMAHGLIHTGDGMKIFMHSRRFLRANRFVICAGPHSTQIEGCDVERIPLGTERGYHIQFTGRESLIQRPICWNRYAFYAIPMQLGLRMGGTVEIKGTHKPKSPERIEFMKNKADRMFGLNEQPDSDWLGFRPTLPDSLPVIGPSSKSPNTFYAFGHQHLGLTLAGITGKLISEVVAGEKPSLDIRPYSADRFKRNPARQSIHRT